MFNSLRVALQLAKQSFSNIFALLTYSHRKQESGAISRKPRDAANLQSFLTMHESVHGLYYHNIW